jgi:hypothetical protein
MVVRAPRCRKHREALVAHLTADAPPGMSARPDFGSTAKPSVWAWSRASRTCFLECDHLLMLATYNTRVGHLQRFVKSGRHPEDAFEVLQTPAGRRRVGAENRVIRSELRRAADSAGSLAARCRHLTGDDLEYGSRRVCSACARMPRNRAAASDTARHWDEPLTCTNWQNPIDLGVDWRSCPLMRLEPIGAPMMQPTPASDAFHIPYSQVQFLGSASPLRHRQEGHRPAVLFAGERPSAPRQYRNPHADCWP